jgi:hypothetical protein
VGVSMILIRCRDHGGEGCKYNFDSVLLSFNQGGRALQEAHFFSLTQYSVKKGNS